MILPSRRWYLVALGLGLLAPLALVLPGAPALLLGADILWVVAFLVDAWRIGGLDLRRFPVSREAPPAFSAGRPLPVVYRWKNPLPRSLVLRVR